MGGAVVIDGGAPVIDGVDIVLDGEPTGGDEWYFARSAFQISGGSSRVIRASTVGRIHAVLGLGELADIRGQHHHHQRICDRSGGGNQPIIRGNTFLEGRSIVFADPGSSGDRRGQRHRRVHRSGDAGDDTIIRGQPHPRRLRRAELR